MMSVEPVLNHKVEKGQIVRNGHLRGQVFKFACVRGEDVVRVAVLPGDNGWPEYRFQNWRLKSISYDDD